MIRSRLFRFVRLGLVLVLLLPCAVAGEAAVDMIRCSSMSSGDVVSLSCDDPETEARIKAEALTPDEARAIGCPPVVWADEPGTRSGAEMAEPEPYATGEPEPTYATRTPDPAVAGRVDRAWDRIERWLGAHASATLRKLKFPATPQDLAQWEKTRERTLPDDLYASYLRHDGADGNLGNGFQLPPSYGLLGVYDIDYINWGKCQDLVIGGDLDAADPEHGEWNGHFMAIGDTSYGQELFVEPGTGRVGESAWGQKVRYDGPMGWPSYADMLEALAGALERGGPLRDWYPTVTPGCELRWAGKPGGPLPTGCAGGPRPTPTPTPTVEPTPEKLSAKEARAVGCAPRRRPPVVRMPAPVVRAQVDAVWRRIERWLARKAPATYKRLERPALPLDIAKAEAAMGLRFPDDLRASLLRHDGSGDWGFGPAPFYDLMSAKDIRSEWAMLCGIVVDTADPFLDWWDGHLIPFADAHDGGNLFIDTRTGKTGEFYNEDGLTLDGDVVWPSYLALLKATARSLETGRPIRGWRPTVTKGELDWDEA